MRIRVRLLGPLLAGATAIACQRPHRSVAPLPLPTPVASSSSSAAASNRPPCGATGCESLSAGFRFLHPTIEGRDLAGALSWETDQALLVGRKGAMLRADAGAAKLVTLSADGLPPTGGGARNVDASGLRERAADLIGVVRSGPGEAALFASHAGLVWLREGVVARGPAPPDAYAFEGLVGGTPPALLLLPGLARSMLGAAPAPAVFDGRGFRLGGTLPKGVVFRVGITRGTTTWLGGDGGALVRSEGTAAFDKEVVDPPARGDVAALWISPRKGVGIFLTKHGEVYELDGRRWTNTAAIEEDGVRLGNVGAVWGTDDGSELWAAGDRLFRRVSGEPWRVVPLPAWIATQPSSWISGITPRLSAIDGSGPNDVWIVGRRGIVFHWDGARLRELGARETEEQFFGLIPLPKSGWLAFAEDGVVLRGRGLGFVREPARAPTARIRRAVRALDGNIVALDQARDVLVRTGDEGAWRIAAAKTKLWRIDGAIDEHHLFCLDTDGGKVVRWDQGVQRSSAAIAPANTLVGLAVAGPRDIWVASEHAVLRGDGETFAVVGKQPDDELQAVAASGPDDVWIAGGSPDGAALLLHWDGKRLGRVLPPSGSKLYGLHVRGPRDVVAVDLLGTVVRFDGERWTVRETPAANLHRVVSLDDGSVVATDVGVIVGSGPL